MLLGQFSRSLRECSVNYRSVEILKLLWPRCSFFFRFNRMSLSSHSVILWSRIGKASSFLEVTHA